MKLTKTTDYGIRVVLYLARKHNICTSVEISRYMGIPQNYLNKIIRQLRKAGLIISYRGIKGGFKLAKDPNEITLYEIVNQFEADLDYKKSVAVMAVENNSTINMESVQISLNKAFEKMETSLKDITIADLLKEDTK